MRNAADPGTGTRKPDPGDRPGTPPHSPKHAPRLNHALRTIATAHTERTHLAADQVTCAGAPRSPAMAAPPQTPPPSRSRPHPAVPTHAWTWTVLMNRALVLAVLRLAPLWRAAAASSPPSRIRHLVRAFIAHLSLAPGPDIPGPAPSPTTPPPPRNPRQATHRRCPITGNTQPSGPRSAPLPPPLTTAGFRAHHPRKESTRNGAVSAPSRVLRTVHHDIPRRGGGVKPEDLTTP